MIGCAEAFEGLYGPKPIEGEIRMNERYKELLAQDEELNKIIENDPAKVFDLMEEKIKIQTELMEIARSELGDITNGVKE